MDIYIYITATENRGIMFHDGNVILLIFCLSKKPFENISELVCSY